MKSFAKYLAESERTYDYRIKLCGRIPDEQVRDLKSKLDQFDPVKMGEVKVTPIQKILTDFPNNQNDAVTMFDVSFRYPAIEPQIKQLYQLMGGNPNLVVMQTQDYVDGLVDEADRVETENKDLLANTDYPKNNKVQDGLKKDYGVEAHNHVVLQNQYRSDFTVAGGKTPAAKTSNDLPQGTRSPMTNIKRPPKPATGSQPRG